MRKRDIVSLFFIILGIISVQAFAVEEQDSLALVALYDSTDGDNWNKNRDWNNGPVADWYGVTAFDNRVQDLFLHGNNLAGSIPPEFGNLTSVRWVYFHHNNLTGSIPPEIGNLTNLEKFEAQRNNLTGSIPPEIGNLDSLNTLYLFRNNLTGSIPPEIGNLTDLHWLHLDSNNLTGSIPPEIGNLTDLDYLYLNSNNLTGLVPPEIGDITGLRYLHLHDNELVDLPSLSGLPLNRLRIENNKFTFEDIEPNINVPRFTFTYSPQDSVGETQDTTVYQGSSLSIFVSVGGDSNRYQWKKDGDTVSGATDSVYTMNPVALSDAGSYICEITNTVATKLTLFSRPINVSVADAPFITVISPNGGENLEVDDTCTVTWSSGETSGGVKIEYSVNNSSDWTEIIASIPDSGAYSWTVPDTPSDSCLVMVTDTNGSLSDTSNDIFKISPPSAVPETNLPTVYSISVTKGIITDNQLEVRYGLPEKAKVKFSVYDIKGAKVEELSEEKPAGIYSAKINMSGKSAGVYFIKMEANGRKFTGRGKFLLI